MKLYWMEPNTPTHAESLNSIIDSPKTRQSTPLKDPLVRLVYELKLVYKLDLNEFKLACIVLTALS